MPFPVRFRYTLLSLVAIFSLLYLYIPFRGASLAPSKYSSTRWDLDEHGELRDEKDNRVPLQSLPQQPETAGTADEILNPDQSVLEPAGSAALDREFASWRGKDYKPRPKPPYKPPPELGPPVLDPFPLLSHPPSETALKDLLQPPAVNAPPREHVPEQTPLFIGFTRNWPQLIQCVASYITAGWPAEDIYVVENTGVMHANLEGKLSLQNPFYLNHTQLAMLGTNVIFTPTLLSFAQLQNFYAWTALQHNWTEYFWSHQDLLVFSFENSTEPLELPKSDPSAQAQRKEHQSLYARAAAILRYLRQPGIPKWANHFFAYDHLTLVNRDAHLAVGGWDTHIPFYGTDCDMYDRLMWAGYWQGETPVGVIRDVSTVLADVGALFRIPGVEARFSGDPGPLAGPADDNRAGEADGPEYAAERARIAEQDPAFQEAEARRRAELETKGETWEHLVEVAQRMESAKYVGGGGWRNYWQLRQSGGQGEPFHRDPEGFETGVRMLIEAGRRVFAEKWGHRGCDIVQMGIKAEDAWRLERDWDPETEGSGSEGHDW